MEVAFLEDENIRDIGLELMNSGSFHMPPQIQEYKGHRIELREPRTGRGIARQAARAAQPAALELLIDEQQTRYGKMPGGKYFLHEYSYDWRGDLMDLARRFVDYRDRNDKIREQPYRRGK